MCDTLILCDKMMLCHTVIFCDTVMQRYYQWYLVGWFKQLEQPTQLNTTNAIQCNSRNSRNMSDDSHVPHDLVMWGFAYNDYWQSFRIFVFSCPLLLQLSLIIQQLFHNKQLWLAKNLTMDIPKRIHSEHFPVSRLFFGVLAIFLELIWN